MKRGQAAMEYLMTYGWAILVIVIVLAALLYLGVFNLGSRVPEQCNFQAGTLCTSAKVTPGGKTLTLQNSRAQDMLICNIICDDRTASTTTGLPTGYTNTAACGGTGSIATVAVGKAATVTDNTPAEGCRDSAGTVVPVGTIYRGKVYIEYSAPGEATGSASIAAGDLTATIQPS